MRINYGRSKYINNGRKLVVVISKDEIYSLLELKANGDRKNSKGLSIIDQEESEKGFANFINPFGIESLY